MLLRARQSGGVARASDADAIPFGVEKITHRGLYMQSIFERLAAMVKRAEKYALNVKDKDAVVAIAFGVALLAALGLLVYGLYKL